jgi:hypothetical protein
VACGRLEDLLSRPGVLAGLKSDPGPLGLDTLQQYFPYNVTLSAQVLDVTLLPQVRAAKKASSESNDWASKSESALDSAGVLGVCGDVNDSARARSIVIGRRMRAKLIHPSVPHDPTRLQVKHDPMPRETRPLRRPP